MFKVTVNELEKIVDELAEKYISLGRELQRLKELKTQCKHFEFSNVSRKIGLMSEELLTGRRNMYELMLSLKNISLIYRRSENNILENFDEYGRVCVRDAEWIEIDFPNEIMQLINEIKVDKEGENL